ncbi:hypothetical protein [Labedella endophytica]|uniref:Uncharacterized protein n=1 Tax=Labedella endophytica TaxID=1523160 RepID=A0A3S0VIB6_9MICO|nr:hypothetical protein [Labedella endophytica]RUR03171.1 hypothetical protein ELQ94_01040 [Labedella endophytica]
MRCITYAGENVITSNDVAAALVELTAALAKRGQAEAVRIPIVYQKTGAYDWAELVVGVGNDVLSIPHEWEGDEVDFTEQSAELRRHLDAVRPKRPDEVVVGGPRDTDPGSDPVDRFFDIDIRFDDGTPRG